MGKKTKVGKARKDKFYRLAKETGYRSRASFKLTQLNRKFEFFNNARVVVDLCAAPGGWLQVAAENTPVSALIVGVDLVGIRPVNKCHTFQGDITTDKCKQTLKQELKTWKADVFLNDGAPNIGKNWIYDAYQQAELTLYAVKLATSFLRKGGWFVTKLFRSKDYFSVLWVMQQLFRNVTATKPQASRAESAEIFVVCQGFLAPDKIDPKFLNPKYVFKDVDEEPNLVVDLMHPEKKKRHRRGYAEGDYTLYHTLSALTFCTSSNYMKLLAASNQVILDDDRFIDSKYTTVEIKECIKDIKVLGKKDIKGLLNWRKKLIAQFDLTAKEEEKKEEVPAEKPDSGDEDEAEEKELEEQLNSLREEERKALKRKLKKTRREKAKLQHRMDLKMVIPNDVIDTFQEEEIFNLKQIKTKKQLDELPTELPSSDDDVDDIVEDAPPKRGARETEMYDKGKRDYAEYSSDDDGMESDPDLSDDDHDEANLVLQDEQNPLMTDLQSTETRSNNRIAGWFNKESFADLEDDLDDDADVERVKDHSGDEEQLAKDKQVTSTSKVTRESNSDDNSDSDSDYDISQMRPTNTENAAQGDEEEGFDVVPVQNAASMKLDAVGMAIGSALVQSQKRKRDIIDGGYHRYMFDDDGLPDWFTQEETKHQRINIPVTKGDIQEYKDRLKEVNARPIKKIAEAKARKKKKELRKLDRARKRSEVITDNTEFSEREKWQQIKSIYKKAGLTQKKKKEVSYVVAKKGMGKSVRRPSGVTGQFRVVDPRLKKDKRAEKIKMKRGGKKGQSRKKGRR